MGGTAKKGRAVKKQKASGLTAEQTEEEYAKAPHSFVIHRGKVGKAVQELAADFRKVNILHLAQKNVILRNELIEIMKICNSS